MSEEKREVYVELRRSSTYKVKAMLSKDDAIMLDSMLNDPTAGADILELMGVDPRSEPDDWFDECCYHDSKWEDNE